MLSLLALFFLGTLFLSVTGLSVTGQGRLLAAPIRC